jgi:3-carboxy-cis,cis-muconate cycloisomerase
VETRERGGGSSTMPHKRNPVGASVVLAAAVRAPGLVATMIAAMPQEHERGLGGWQAEWETLPELVRVTAGAARAAANVVGGLVIDAGRMRENLALTDGLVASEAVAMVLAPHIGRAEAQRLLEAATRRARERGEALAETLATDAAVIRHLDRQAIERHLRPEHYVGAARTFIERVLTRWTNT